MMYGPTNVKVTNVVISVIPRMINVVNGLRFLTLGFFP